MKGARAQDGSESRRPKASHKTKGARALARAPLSCPLYRPELTENTAFLEFPGAFADLESIVIDLDLVVTPLEFAVLFPGELYGFSLAGFEFNRDFSREYLVAFFTCGEGAGTE